MNTKVRNIVILVFTLFLITALFYSIKAQRPVELESGYRLVMGTFARVIIIANDKETAQTCAKNAFEEIDKVDNLMSAYKEDSEISLVNKEAFQKEIPVSESTYEVLQKSVEFGKLTDGAFDITLGPLIALFRNEKETQITSTQEEIEQTQSKVGYEKLILNEQNRTVKFDIDGMKLDLGGIAKGYAIDKAFEAIKKSGALGAMVDIGGDVRCFGQPSKGKENWVIGIQNPDLKENTTSSIILKLKILEGAITTSGDYQQFAVIDGKRQSHIIDPQTGSGAEGPSSVTIITDNATDADALATAVSVMGIEKGLALIEKLPNTEAILLSSQPGSEIIKSSGAGKYIK
jgi:thiamine biosynthesis lipoprotein